MRWSRTVLVAALLAAAALWLVPATAAASTVRFLSDAELIARADRVVHGSVTGQRVVRVRPGVIYTISTLAVIEDLTGVAGDSVEVWERGGTVGNESMSVAGGVRFELGEEVVVCLKSGAAGFHTLGMGMAKFDLEPAGAGERQLIRRLADTLVIGGTPALRGLSLGDFRRLATQVTGRTPRAARRSEALETPAVSPEPFTYRGARWVEADLGTAVRYYVNSPAPSPLLGGASPAAAVQTALAAWTNPAAASVILQYFGTTSQPASNGPWNGIPAKSVVISFEDPDGEIDDPVLAITHSFTSTGTGGTVNGTRFDGYTRAAIKFQNAVDLPASYRQTLNFSRIITHEVGHSIGLSHTQTGGAVPNPTANIMYASCCYTQTPTPPALGVDDIAGLVYLYPTDRSCNYSVTPLSAPYAAAGGSGNIQLTTYTSCAWTAASNSPFVTLTSSSSGFGPTVLFYNVAANAGAARSGTLVVAGQTVTITQSGPLPAMTLDRSSLSFAATTTAGGFAQQPAAQLIQLTQPGGAPVSWVTTPTQPWLQVSPASGAGSAALVVSVVSTGTLPDMGVLNGSIVLSYNGASTGTATIPITLTLTRATSAAPFGVVDTPLDNTSGVTGAVPFTGWALDEGEVAAVSLCRHPVAGEAAAPDGRCGGAAQIYVADALFVEGARPDVQAAFPAYPRSNRGGWGAMVLTNMLPGQGNGTYVFTIYARDRDGHVTLLGTRTMSCSNLTASLPFGTIDTPGQGETVSGNAYVNFGWALTQTPKAIPTDGSTLTVYVDGVMVGHPSYDHYRADIAALFPRLSNSDGAVGFWLLDTTTLSNGLHTIVWTATDSAGYTQGLGSRYFIVANGTAITATAPPALETAPVR